MQKPLSFKVDESVIARLEAEATAKKVTVSDILRWAVEAYFQGEGARVQNMKTLMYEIVKTRAVVVRGIDLPEEKETLLLELAGEDAATYLEGLKNGKH